jgi:hypothetical protein
LARAVVALKKLNASDRATYAAALERKDEQIVAMVVKVTDAVVTNNHGMQASNANIERNSADIQEVKTAVMSLSSAMHSIQVRRA